MSIFPDEGDLVVKIIHLMTIKDAWDLFASEYSQIGSGDVLNLCFEETQTPNQTSSGIV